MADKDKRKRLPRGQGREKILKAATELFLKDGFEATSPQAIYAACGVGQGSFYHHFSGKEDLAHVVLQELVAMKLAQLNQILAQTENPKERLEAYLSLPRNGMKGCTFGRFMYETSAQKPAFHEPVNTFFNALEQFINENMASALEQKLIPPLGAAEDLTCLLVAQIQGGYILSRIHQDGGQQDRCIASLARLLGLSLQK